jgi:hypothetical protein
MEFLITESQLRVLLQEEEKSQLGLYVKNMYAFTKQMLNKVFRSYGINLRMLLTWGTSVGGLVLPLDQYLRTQHLGLNEDQRMLVLVGIIFALFFETKRPFMKIMSLIKENGLEDIFQDGLRKGTQLRDAFTNFLSSANTGVGTFLEAIAYSFLIPIITDVQSVLGQTEDIETAAILIAERLLAAGVILVGRQTLIDLVKNVLKKIG